MLDSSFKLGRLAGVEINANISLIFLAVLLTLSMSNSYLPRQVEGYGETVYLIAGMFTSLLFLLSVLAHEIAHAVVARWFNIPVRRIVLYFMGGIAEFEEEARTATQSFWVAFAGPLMSAFLGGVGAGLGYVLGTHTLMGASLLWLGLVNLFLAAFNVLPALPLDGGQMLRATLWFITRNHRQATRITGGVSLMFAWTFIVLGGVQLLLTGDVLSSLSTLLIGYILWRGTRGNLQYVRLQYKLEGLSLQNALTHKVWLHPDWSIAYAMDVLAMNGIYGMSMTTPVRAEGELVGFVNREAVVNVPRLHWATTRISQLMLNVANLPRLSSETALFDAIRKLEQVEAAYAVVTEEARPVGVISHRELVRFADLMRLRHHQTA